MYDSDAKDNLPGIEKGRTRQNKEKDNMKARRMNNKQKEILSVAVGFGTTTDLKEGMGLFELKFKNNTNKNLILKIIDTGHGFDKKEMRLITKKEIEEALL